MVDALYPGTVKKTEDFPLSARIAMALPWTNQIAVERLINVPKGPGAIPVDFGAFNAGKPLMDMIKTMYPNAHTTIVDADHRIQVSAPEAVVAAIRRVMPPADVLGC